MADTYGELVNSGVTGAGASKGGNGLGLLPPVHMRIFLALEGEASVADSPSSALLFAADLSSTRSGDIWLLGVGGSLTVSVGLEPQTYSDNARKAPTNSVAPRSRVLLLVLATDDVGDPNRS